MNIPTPAPWRACLDTNDMPQLLYSGLIASLHHSGDPDGYVAVISDEFDIGDATDDMLGECQANALLMAAAPDLLAALQMVLDENEDGLHPSPCTMPDCWVEAAQQAIAKATGPAGSSAGTTVDAG